MSRYELIYLAPTKLTEDELGPLTTRVRDLIGKHGGRITFEDNLGKKRLAYPIKKITQCYYLLTQFEAEPAALKALNHDLQLADDVVRHLVVKRAEIARLIPAPAVPAPAGGQTQEEDLARAKLETLDRKLDELLTKDLI